MPVRGLRLRFLTAEFLSLEGQFYRRCFYHNLVFDLRTGRSMSMVVENGKIRISVSISKIIKPLMRQRNIAIGLIAASFLGRGCNHFRVRGFLYFEPYPVAALCRMMFGP